MTTEKKPRKKRSASKLVLCVAIPDQMATYREVESGGTIKDLRKAAEALGVGDYAIMCRRDAFTVSQRVITVLSKIGAVKKVLTAQDAAGTTNPPAPAVTVPVAPASPAPSPAQPSEQTPEQPKPAPRANPLVAPSSGAKAELGLSPDGTQAFARLGEEVEWVGVERTGGSRDDAIAAASGAAHRRLRKRLEQPALGYFYGDSHPMGAKET